MFRLLAIVLSFNLKFCLPTQAEIAAEGQDQLTKLAVALADIATKIPEDINWVLQVDGHTDDIPIRAGRYTDNWDLSTERDRWFAQSEELTSRLDAENDNDDANGRSDQA